MTTLYLSLTDQRAVSWRERLRAIQREFAGPDHGEHWTPDQSDTYSALLRAESSIPDTVRERCTTCGRDHDALWTVRRAAKPWGHFGTAVINRTREVIDGSLPHTVAKLPPDAVRVSPDESARLWHDDSGSHTFGGPDVASLLRATIAEQNARDARASR